MASTLPDDSAPSASLDHLEAQAAPTHPRAPPGPLGSLPWPQELASGWPKVEDVPLSTSRHDHHYETKQIAGRWLLKSGTDFRDLSRIRLKLLPGGGLEVEPPEHFTVTMALAEGALAERAVHPA